MLNRKARFHEGEASHMNAKDMARTIAAIALSVTILSGCGGSETTGAKNDAYETSDIARTSDNTEFMSEGVGSKDEASPKSDTQDVRPETSKLTRHVSASLSARDFDAASAELDKLLKTDDVIIMGDDLYTYDYREEEMTRHLSLRIKSEGVDALVEALRTSQSWETKSLSCDTQDMSANYRDNEKRIESLEKRYEFYKQKADETDDENVMLELTERMLDTLEQIESLKTENEQTDLDVAWSTAEIELSWDSSAKDVDTTGDVYQRLTDTIGALPGNIVAMLAWVLLAIVTLIPTLLVVALVAAIVILIARVSAKRRQERGPKNPTEKPTNAARERRDARKARRMARESSTEPSLPTNDEEPRKDE